MRPQLLCTFTYVDKLTVSIGQIYKAYNADDVSNMKVYSYVQTPNNVICVYNVSTSERRLKDTISINRKKDTNTFYSINALNSLIRVLNNGVLDKSFAIEWPNYKDTLLLADGEFNCKMIQIKELAV
jgi:hypothetical protein